MRRLAFALIALVTLLGSSYAWAEFFPSTLNAPIHRIACEFGVNQRGCCSCQGGRVVCCDGATSPSCRC